VAGFKRLKFFPVRSLGRATDSAIGINAWRRKHRKHREGFVIFLAKFWNILIISRGSRSSTYLCIIWCWIVSLFYSSWLLQTFVWSRTGNCSGGHLQIVQYTAWQHYTGWSKSRSIPDDCIV